MKTLVALAAGLLAGCTADQQQRFADGYFGEPGHTFREAMIGNGDTGYSGVGYAPPTTLDDVNQSIQDLKDQEQRNADRAEEMSEMRQMHDDLYR
jgi:hypothetical protein